MAGGRNFDRVRRQNLEARVRSERVTIQDIETVMQTLAFRAKAPEKKAGNWVVLPASGGDPRVVRGPRQFFEAHRSRECLRRSMKEDLDPSDRMVRLCNEDVEALGLRRCRSC